MRTKKSVINISTAIISQFILIVLGFISRKVMIDSVGVEYLGINGLMSNILVILSLAESGMGTAMVYALYKPLAENNISKIQALMKFYKIVYRVLAILTALIGLSILPFLNLLMKGNTIDNSVTIYLMFLFSSVSSYLYSYKISMNNADQNKYIATIFNTATQVIVLIAKIIILYVTKNYILFLSIDIGSTLLKNIIFSNMMDKRYPYLKEKTNEKLDNDTKNILYTNIKSLFFNKLGYIISISSDNLVISSMISVATVGLYSNYTTLTSAALGFVTIFIANITASLGNLIAKESKEKVYEIFKVSSLINFWLYGFSFICLFCLSQPFIAIWLGEEYLMREIVVFLIVFIFLMYGLMEPIEAVKNAAGLYKPDKYVPLIAAIVNMIISILLVKPFGICGVFLGTIISTLSFSFWIRPIIVYKIIFKENCYKYFIDILLKFLSIFLVAFLCYYLGELLFKEYNLKNLIGRGVICIIIPNVLFFVIMRKSKEFKYLVNIINIIFTEFRKKVIQK